MPTLLEILNDPNYVNANPATKAAIFDKYAPEDKDYSGANGATQMAIRQRFGLGHPAPAPKPPEPTMLGEAGRSFEQAADAYKATAGTFGADPVASVREYKTSNEARERKYGHQAGLDEVIGAYDKNGVAGAASEAISQIPNAVAGQAAPITQMVGGAKLGSLAGAGIGSIVPGVGTGIGATVGGVGGALLATAPQHYADNLVEQLEQQEKDHPGQKPDLNRFTAGATAVGQSALDVGGAAFTVGKRLVGKIIGSKPAKEGAEALVAAAKKSLAQSEVVAGRSLPRTMAVGAAHGLIELPTEVAQQVLQVAQSGGNVLSPDAMKSYAQSLYGAAMLGPTLGAVASPMERSAARAEVEKAEPNSGSATPSVSEDDLEKMRAEQGHVDYMKDQREEKQKNLMQGTDKEGNGLLFGSMSRGVKPTETVQGKPLPEAQKGFDAYGRPLTDEATADDGTPNAAPAPMINTLDESRDMGGLAAEKESLVAQREALKGERSPQAAKMRAALETRIAEVNAALMPKYAALAAKPGTTVPPNEMARIEKENKQAVKQLPPDLQAKQAAGAFDQTGQQELRIAQGLPTEEAPAGEVSKSTILNSAALKDAGLHPSSGFFKQLHGLDLSTQGDRTAAAEIIGRAMIPGSGIAGKTKERLQALYDAKLQQEVNPAQPGLDFNAAPAVTPQTQTQAAPVQEAAPSTAPVAQEVVNPEATQVAQSEQAAPAEAPTQPAAPPTVEELQAKVAEARAAIEAIEAQQRKIRKADNHLPQEGTAPRVLYDNLTTQFNAAFDQWAQAHDALQAANPAPVEAPAAPTAPVTIDNAPAVLDDSVFKAMGIGATAKIRKNPDVLGKDMNDPAQNAWVRKVMDAYKIGRSQSIVDKIDAYLSRFPLGGENANSGTTTQPTGAATASDTAPKRRAGKSRMGVDSARSAAADVATPDATGVSDATDAGLEHPTDGTPNDLARAGDVSAAVGVAQVEDIGKAIGKLAFNPKGTVADVMAVADTAHAANFLTKESMESLQELAKDEDTTKQSMLAALNARLNDDSNGAERVNHVLINEGKAAGAQTTALVNALEAHDPHMALTVLQYNAEGRFTDIEVDVADKLLALGKQLPTLQMVDSLGNDKKGRPITGQYNTKTDTVYLVRGLGDSHTFLHEVVHAFVHRFILNQMAENGPHQGFRDLDALYEHVQKVAPHLAEAYGMSNLSEFASEALSNRDFQMELMGIQYQKVSGFRRLFQAIAKMLGIKVDTRESSALMAAITHVDGLMREGRDLQLDNIGREGIHSDTLVNLLAAPGTVTPAAYAAIAKAKTQPQRTAMTAIVGAIREADASMADRFRQKTVDVLAPLVTKMSQHFTEGVTNAFGQINPVQYIRQAFDHARVALAMFELGGLRMNADGYWEARELRDPTTGKLMSAKTAIDEISTLAKKTGESFEDTKARVATVLEGMRLQELRQHNDTLEQLALMHEARGEFDQADKKREEKIFLHKRFAEIDSLVDVFNKSPEIQEIQRVLNATRTEAIEAMVASGRLSRQRGDDWIANVGYVPFDRIQDVFENKDIIFNKGRKGIAALGSDPELKGSLGRPVANAIDNYMKTLAWMTEQSMRNSASVRTANMMVQLGYADKLPTANMAQNKHMVLPKLFENGKPVYFEMASPYDFAAFVQAPEINTATIKFFSGASRFLRTTVTATPPFALKQVIEDAQRVMFYSGVKNPTRAMTRTLANFPKLWAQAWMGKQSAKVKELTKLGIFGEFDFNPINPVEKLQYDTGAIKRGVVKSVLNRLEQVTKASDMAARLAVYEQTLAEGGSHALAQTRARELINFNRRGASSTMRVLTHTVPFFNAWAQGLDLMYRGVTGKDSSSGLGQGAARKMFITRIAMMTGLGFVYAAAMSDDDKYSDLPDDVRDRKWVFPKVIRDTLHIDGLPVPIELASVFKSIPERVVQYYKEKGKGEDQGAMKATLSAMKDLALNYAVNPVPSAVRPIFETMANYSLFTHRPLVPANLQKVPNPQKYTSSTSELAKWLGKKTDIAPIFIENAVRSLTGTIGAGTLLMTDSIINPNRPAHASAQLPFMSITNITPGASRTVNEFYDFREKVTTAVSGANDLKTRNPAAYNDFIKENRHLIRAQTYVNNITQELATLRKQRNVIEGDTRREISSADRRAKIDELKQREVKVLHDMRRIRTRVNSDAP